MSLFFKFTLVLLLCIATGNASARTLVIYEQTDFENRVLLNGIIDGIEQSAPQVVIRSFAPGNFYARTFDIDTEFDNAIVLGKKAIREFSRFDTNIKWIAGGYSGDIDIEGVARSLSQNIIPGEIFSDLKKYKPSLKYVHMVVTEDNFEGYIRGVAGAAEEHGLELKIYRALNIRSTARIWFNILKISDSQEDALWMATERFNERSGSLKYITEEAWKKRIISLTTVTDLARRGLAIGYILNPESYGAELYSELMAPAPTSVNTIRQSDATIKSFTRVINHRVIDRIGARVPTNTDNLINRDVVIR